MAIFFKDTLRSSYFRRQEYQKTAREAEKQKIESIRAEKAHVAVGEAMDNEASSVAVSEEPTGNIVEDAKVTAEEATDTIVNDAKITA